MTNVLIVGTIPQTAGVGGVSVHVERLLLTLARRDYPCQLCDYKALPLTSQLRQIASCRVMHLHVSRPLPRLVYALTARLLGKRIVFTIHGNMGRFGRVNNVLDRLTVRLVDVPIAINSPSYHICLSLNRRARLLPAYIPPTGDGYVPAWLIDSIRRFHEQGKRVYSTNASARAFTSDGRETYGIDFLVRYFAQRDDIALILSDPSGQYLSHYAPTGSRHTAKPREAPNGGSPTMTSPASYTIGHTLIVAEPHATTSLYRHVDGTIRATATDGDSLSVKESLSVGLPTLATDCTVRPKGCLLFRYDDADSLTDALSRAECHRTTPLDEPNPVDALMTIYDRLLQ